MAEEIAFKTAGFPTLKGSWPGPWIGSQYIPSCITHRPLPTSQISLKSKKLFMDRRTDIWTDGHLRLALLSRLCQRVDLKRHCYVNTVCPMPVTDQSAKNKLKLLQQDNDIVQMAAKWLRKIPHTKIPPTDHHRETKQN